MTGDPTLASLAEQMGLDADDPVVESFREAIHKRRVEKAAAEAPIVEGPEDEGGDDEHFVDFDAFFDARAPKGTDRAPKPIRPKLFGRRWHVGYDDSPPAAATLRLARMAADGDIRDVDLNDPRVQGQVMLLASELIPKEVLDAWLAKGISTDRLGTVCLWVFGQYRFGPAKGGDGEGEATAPETGASGSSSSGGGSSSPTSTASTGSTSTLPES